MKTKQINHQVTTLSLMVILFFSVTTRAQIKVDVLGRVGMGTTSPSNSLDVLNGNPIVRVGINAGTNYYAAFTAHDISANTSLVQLMGGSAMSGTLFGVNRASAAQLYANSAPMVLGTVQAYGLTLGTSNAARLTILSGGNVGIGTTTPGYKLEVNGTLNVTGTATCAAGAWGSDQQFKTNIDSIHNASDLIKQLKPKTYYFDTTNIWGMNFPSKKQYGFIAQELEEILPELITNVNKSADYDSLGNVIHPATTYKAVYYLELIALLTKGNQEQQLKIDNLSEALVAEQGKTVEQGIINNNLQNQLNQLTQTINGCCTMGEIRSTQTSASYLNQTDIKLTDAQSIVLEQNVPNPFAEQTSISYYLPENTQKAQLLFYNSQGRLIQSTDLIQKGKGTVNVFASDLSNGIYSYTLVVNGKVIETKKMVKQ